MREIFALRKAPALFALALLSILMAVAACTNTAPPSVVSHVGNVVNSGGGVNPVFNQTVTFAVKIPPVPTSKSASSGRRSGLLSAPTPQPTSLYLSPHTGSVTITLVAVNGVSLAHPAPAVPAANVPAGCVPAGCTVTVAGVPAANGVDRFVVVTFTGPDGTGSIISSGVVDVSVPTGTTQTVGGGSSASLVVGGFVAGISLSVTPTTYIQGKPSSGSVVVSALDATGATIIGNAQFANPIVLGLSTTSTTLHFTYPGGKSTYAVTGPLSSPVPIDYDGASTSVTSVTATSIDGNGVVVNASPIPLTVTIVVPSPSPTPTHTPTAPPGGTSLYVLNGMNNAVEEFPSPAPSATPKREFGPTLSLLDCSDGEVPYAVGMVQGVAADAAGNAYVSNNPNCNTTLFLSYTAWQFGPTATAKSAPLASFAAPAAYGFGASTNLSLDPTTQLLLLPASDASTGTPAILRAMFSGSSSSLASVLGGGACIPFIGFTSCDGVDQYSFQTVYTAVVDAKGYTYFGSGADLDGNPVILVFAPGATAPIVYSAIGGPQSDTELDLYPAALAIDGTTLYVLNPGFGPGYSNCGPLDAPDNTCVDGNNHEYVTAYDTTKLVAGSSVDLKPTFILGGDAVGRFGSTPLDGLTQAYSGRMVANKGLLYIANTTGPVCDPTCVSNATNGTGTAPGEIDVYNVSGLKGAHNNIAPSSVISSPALVPAGLFFGATGTATGPPIPAPAIRGPRRQVHPHRYVPKRFGPGPSVTGVNAAQAAQPQSR